jgi:hypothetical protein
MVAVAPHTHGKLQLPVRYKRVKIRVSVLSRLLGVAGILYLVGTLALFSRHHENNSHPQSLSFIAPRRMLVAGSNARDRDVAAPPEKHELAPDLPTPTNLNDKSGAFSFPHVANLRKLLGALKHARQPVAAKVIIRNLEGRLTKGIENVLSNPMQPIAPPRVVPAADAVELQSSRATRMQALIAQHQIVSSKTPGSTRTKARRRSTLPKPVLIPRIKPRVLLITFTFGSVSANAPHLQLFAKSAEHCGADVVFLGDSPPFPMSLSGRVRHVPMTWQQAIDVSFLFCRMSHVACRMLQCRSRLNLTDV